MKPNVLFILIDDLGWRDLSCYGSSFYETPNLDRLAAQGMKFTNAYASCCVCSPTRASIMSGKYPARVGITTFIGGSCEGKLAHVPYLHYLPLEEKSLATTLKENGYSTWHVGKWHLGDADFYPEHHGFDCNIGGGHNGHPRNGYFSPYKLNALEEGPEGEYLTDRLTDEAINLLQQRDKDKPFFLNLWHYAVHTPIQAPQELVEKYHKKAEKLFLDRTEPFVEGDYFPCCHKSDKKIRRRVIQSDAEYAAMVENLDYNIGRVLQSLEKEGILDNTLIFFTSDNGGLATAEGSPTCNLPLSNGKGWASEGGTRVCQIAHWPGKIAAGSVCRENVTSTDFYPTILEALGIGQLPEQHCDGVNLLPLLKGGQDKLEREAIYWHYPHYGNQGCTPHASILCGEWKLVHYFEDNRNELYNLEEDISECNDRSNENPELVRKLEAMLGQWQEDVEASIPEPNPGYEKKMKCPQVPNNAHI